MKGGFYCFLKVNIANAEQGQSALPLALAGGTVVTQVWSGSEIRQVPEWGI
jgi:hypothetical protein